MGLPVLRYNAEVEMETKDCPTCGVVYAGPVAYFRRINERAQGEHWFCLNGHQVIFKKSEAARLREELAAEQERLKRALARENEERMARVKVERKLKRVNRGVCPDCQRTFQNLARHMCTKHGVKPPEGKLP